MRPDAAKRSADICRITLCAPDDFKGWREAARRMIRAGVEPDGIMWETPVDQITDLFAQGNDRLPEARADTRPPRASQDFLRCAESVVLHSDITRFSLLYRVLWRLQAHPRLMDDKADPDVRAMEDLARHVRRDMHKMRAFVRFRAVKSDEGEHYVAWFEPEHHILRANAGFFVRRFTTMHWTILTPRGTLHWNGEALQEGPPATRADAPTGDPVEALWRSYYASTFNPARLKVEAMLKEMPRKYWKNMPETALIPALIAGAQAREARMVQAGEQDFGQRPGTLEGIGKAIQACRRCEIGCNGTRAVMGEGAIGEEQGSAPMMIVGEQPGDTEEAQGRPFVGPAGRLLRAHLADASIGIERSYVTNAVKHFKHVPQGKQRLHQTPTAREVDVCRWWLDSERALVRPRIVLALGASAARSLLGRTVSVQKVRGVPHMLDDGAELWITAHPSYLLRLQGHGLAEEEARFSKDLRMVSARLSELAA